MSRNFLKALVEPKETAALDIVAIHGLNPFKGESNAESTFTWTSKDPNTKRNWLSDEDFLPAHIPNARILLFGYNSNAAFSSSNAGLNEQAKNLLIRLRQEREDCEDRPVIFVCHSLGGLLAKRAIVMACNNGIDKPLYDATYGFCFLAVPHGGGHRAALGAIVAGIARTICFKPENSFLKALEKNDFFAEQNKDDFLQHADDFAFLSFYETKKMNGHMVVQREDAVLGLADKHEPKLAVDADHSEICKFGDANGEDFRPVWKGIESMANKAILKANVQRETKLQQIVTPNPIIHGLPMLEDRVFEGREDYMKQLHNILNKDTGQQNRIVLHGLSGVGKTSLAVHYAHLFRQEYEGIFFISYATSYTMALGYSALDLEMKNKLSTTFAEWCMSPQRRKWLLILDNVDDPAVVKDEQQYSLRQKLPWNPCGHIILTSRRSDLHDYGNLVGLDPFKVKEAVDMLLRRASARRAMPSDPEDAITIANMLGCLPLAIEQCGAFISATNSSLKTYSASFEALAATLQFNEDEFDQDSFSIRSSRRTVLTSWEVSYTQISKTNLDACLLLCILGFLDHESISETMLIEGFKKCRRWSLDGSIRNDFVAGTPAFVKRLASERAGFGLQFALQTLVTYSLLFRSTGRDVVFSMHPMTRYWLTQRRQAGLPNPRLHTIYMLANSYPDVYLDYPYGLSSTVLRRQSLVEAHLGRLLAECVPETLESDEALALLQLILLDVELLYTDVADQIFIGIVIDVDSVYKYAQRLLSRLGCPEILWMRSVTVFFTCILKDHPLVDDDMLLMLRGLIFAGARWEQIVSQMQSTGKTEHTSSTRKDKMLAPSPEEDQDPGSESSPDAATKMTNSLVMPLPSCSTIPDAGSFNGWMGKFVLKLVREWRSRLRILAVADSTKEHQPRAEMHTGNDVLTAWTKHPSLGLSDIEQVVSSQMLLLVADVSRYKLKAALRSPEEEFSLYEYNCLFDDHARLMTSCYESLSERLGCNGSHSWSILLCMVWDFYHLGLKRHAAKLAQSSLDQPLTATNFYAIIKALDVLQFCMRDVGDLEKLEETLVMWLSRFQSVDEDLTRYWTYDNDPILDVLEFLIVFYQTMSINMGKAEHYKARYLENCKERYCQLIFGLCLGCGVGAFGMSFGRLRVVDRNEKPFQWDESTTSYIRGVEAYLRETRQEIRKSARIRTDEAEGCLVLMEHFMSLVQNRPARSIDELGAQKYSQHRFEQLFDSVLNG